MKISNKLLFQNNIKLNPKEKILSINNYPKYYISTHGRYFRKYNSGKIRELKLSKLSNGYLQATLSKAPRKYRGQKVKNAKPTIKKYLIHRLVAEHFVPNPYTNIPLKYLCVHHLNRNPQDNHYKNLMWSTKIHHDFLHSILKIAVKNQNTLVYREYRSIPYLANSVLHIQYPELIEYIRTTQDYIVDGDWFCYLIEGKCVGVQFKHDPDWKDDNDLKAA